MLRRIPNQLNIKQPKFISFSNILRISTDEIYHSKSNQYLFSFKANEVKNEMTEKEIMYLLKKYKRDFNFNYTINRVNEQVNLIKNAFKTNKILHGKDIIKKDIHDNTIMNFSLNQWNITDLVRKYQLTSIDVFKALVMESEPFGLGYLSHDNKKIDDKQIRELFQQDEKYACFDYWNGIAIKNSFPINEMNDETPFILNMKKYNDRNNYMGYHHIISLLISKLDKRNDNFKKYSKVIKDYEEKEEIDDKKITSFNKALIENNSKLNKEFKENKQNYLNHRLAKEEDEKDWEFMTTPYYEKYIKDNQKYCELSYTFQLDINIYPKILSIENISIVNILLFGKTNVNQLLLERLLSLVRYKFDIKNDTFQLDNFVIDRNKYIYSNTAKRYDVYWKEDNMNELKFAKTDDEKLYVVKNLIQLMNEVDPKYLNFENYRQITQWYYVNDLSIQTINNLIVNTENDNQCEIKMIESLK